METPTPSANGAQLVIIQQKLALDNKIRNGMNWFYWIAGLSLLNTIIYLSGNDLTFVIGLGVTQIVDGFMYSLSEEFSTGGTIVRLVGLVIDMIPECLFIVAGILGRKRYRAPILIAMVLYFLDGLLLLLLGDLYGAGFHAFALFGVWSGLRAISELEALEKTGDSESIESLRARMPSLVPQTTPEQRRTRWILIGLILSVPVILSIIIAFQN